MTLPGSVPVTGADGFDLVAEAARKASTWSFATAQLSLIRWKSKPAAFADRFEAWGSL